MMHIELKKNKLNDIAEEVYLDVINDEYCTCVCETFYKILEAIRSCAHRDSCIPVFRISS